MDTNISVRRQGQVERERETGKQRQRRRKGGTSTFAKPMNDTPFEVGPRIRDETTT